MNGRNTGTSSRGRLRRLALAPVEQLAIGRLQTVPYLLDLLDIEPEGVGQRLLGEPRRNSDAKRAGGQLEQREPARHIEMIEHFRQHRRRIGSAGQAQPVDRVGNADGAIVERARSPLGRRPQQRHGLGHVADIVAAHVEQHRIDPLLGQLRGPAPA